MYLQFGNSRDLAGLRSRALPPRHTQAAKVFRAIVTLNAAGLPRRSMLSSRKRKVYLNTQCFSMEVVDNVLHLKAASTL